MRAFIFSLDAFVAFTLALIAIYSLIFFSSVPSGYYATLAQAHSLATDGLEALALTPCDSIFSNEQCATDSVNLLEYLAYRSGDPQDVSFVLDKHIPKAFGYKLETKQAGSWTTFYDSASDRNTNNRPPESRKLSVSAYGLAFQYNDAVPRLENPYSYRTCNGGLIACGVPTSNFVLGSSDVRLVRLVVYT